jgi:sugar lactone lactonase YvrE
VPDWLVRLPVGPSLTAGLAGIVLDDAGNSYITGISGSSSNTDITTAAHGPDGTLVWSRTFNGPENWHDQARGLALSPDGGILYVVGNTPGPQSFAQVLLLAYDTGNGSLLMARQYSSGPGTSEHGAAVATDPAGNIYIGGGTVGDGADALILAFDPAGQLLWKQTWDGPAFAPYSQDQAFEVIIHPDGNPVVLIYGVMASNHPDYIVNKYAAGSGAMLWSARWGSNGQDSPNDMEIDAQGGVYVTGSAILGTDHFSTIKLNGATGALVWQAYDHIGYSSGGRALSLDGQGGVYITGSSDPDDDRSNQNDNMYTIKRTAANGTQVWTHFYGANCLRCLDVAADVSVDPANAVFVAGYTSSPPYSADSILFALDPDTGIEAERGVIDEPLHTVSTLDLRLDPASNLWQAGDFYHVNTGQVDMFVAKYPSLGGGGIPCADTSKFLARCINRGAGNKLQVQLTMTDLSHAGEPVTFEVDGSPQVVTINGAKAQLVIGGAAPGSHTAELTDPAGCFPLRTFTCP